MGWKIPGRSLEIPSVGAAGREVPHFLIPGTGTPRLWPRPGRGGGGGVLHPSHGCFPILAAHHNPALYDAQAGPRVAPSASWGRPSSQVITLTAGLRSTLAGSGRISRHPLSWSLTSACSESQGQHGLRSRSSVSHIRSSDNDLQATVQGLGAFAECVSRISFANVPYQH